jgi:hypothetical protein
MFEELKPVFKETYTMVRKWTFPIQFREGLKKLKIKL